MIPWGVMDDHIKGKKATSTWERRHSRGRARKGKKERILSYQAG